MVLHIQGQRSRSGDRRTNVLTEIASLTHFLQARSPRIIYRSKHHSLDVKESCGDLRTSMKILSAVTTHSWPELLGIQDSTLSKILTGLRMRHSFPLFPGGLKPRMDTYLRVCRREVNQNPVTMPGLKQILLVMFWTPK